MNAVEEAILSMMVGLCISQYGLWCWKMDLERGSFRMGDGYYLATLGPFFSLSQISLIGLSFLCYWRGVVISW